MTERDEAGHLSMFFIDKLIQIADKYEIDREKYVKVCVMALVPTVDMINFKSYKPMEGE